MPRAAAQDDSSTAREKHAPSYISNRGRKNGERAMINGSSLKEVVNSSAHPSVMSNRPNGSESHSPSSGVRENLFPFLPYHYRDRS
jgi:hypothetical protein